MPTPGPVKIIPIAGATGSKNWKDRLYRKEQTIKQMAAGEQGKPLANHANIMIALEHAPEWAGVFIFDELKQQVKAVKLPPIGGTVPRAWIDGDNTEALVWFQANGIGVLSCEMLGSCIDAFARRHTVNHLKNYLNGLVWDGVNRVDTWLSTYFGVDCSDPKTSRYVLAVGLFWMISAVARVLKAGPVQADHILILEGDQGLGKSTALRAMAGAENFTDALPDIGTKDAQDHASNYWIIEMSELSAIRKSDVEAIKNFISRQEEKFRRAYGHIEQTVRRYCVFAGTTNKSDYLKDETGNRRFWPVKCTKADVEGITRDRDQLWAEAVHLYKAGAKWWPESETLIAEMSAQQGERMEVDVWHAKIAAYVEGRGAVTAVEVLTEIGVELHRMTQLDRNRVGRCLRALGYEFSRTRELGRCYVRGRE